MLLVACGGGAVDPSEDPKQAVLNGLESLTGEETTMTIFLDSDQASMSALLADMDSPTSPAMIETVLSTRLSFGGNNVTDIENVEFEMKLDVGDESLIEVVEEGYDVYARAQVPELVEAFGGDPAELDRGLEGMPPELDFVNDAVAGEWIHLTGVQEFSEMAGGMADPSQMTAQQKRMLEALENAFEENATFEEGDDPGPGTNVDIRVEARPMVEELMNIGLEASGLPAEDGSREMFDMMMAQFPEGDFIIDTWIDGDELTQIRVDVPRNIEELGGDPLPGVETLGVVIKLDPFVRTIDVPEESVDVAFMDLMKLALSAGAGGASVGAPAEATEAAPNMKKLCKQLAALPKKQVPPEFEELCSGQ